jgi:mRNA interferase MazF
VIRRGEIYWAQRGEPRGSTPAKRRPLLVVQADAYNASGLRTVLAVVITSNTASASMPGNVFLPAGASSLPQDSSVNVTALITLNKSELEDTDAAGMLPGYLMDDVDRGLRLVLDL